nr:hypothetical protein BRARA_C01540 [Ipomoea trifida]
MADDLEVMNDPEAADDPEAVRTTSRLEAALAATELRTPRIQVISNVDAQPHSDPETIKKILARQVIAGIVKRVNKGADIENIAA